MKFFVSVNGEPIEIPEKNQMASAHRLIWLGTFEAQEVMISVTDRMGTLVAAQEMELGALHENAWQAVLQSETARILQPSECSISERNAQIHVSVSAAGGRNVVCSVRCDRRMEVYTKRKNCGYRADTWRLFGDNIDRGRK